jgi:hypothetical protein
MIFGLIRFRNFWMLAMVSDIDSSFGLVLPARRYSRTHTACVIGTPLDTNSEAGVTISCHFCERLPFPWGISFSSAPEQFLFRLPVDLGFSCILRLHFAKLIGAKEKRKPFLTKLG